MNSRPNCLYVSDPGRTMGTLPVAEHLRPVGKTLVPEAVLYERLSTPSAGPHWRWYDVKDFIPVRDALAMPIAGEA